MAAAGTTTTTLLRPTLHVEIQLTSKQTPISANRICTDVAQYLLDSFVSLQVGWRMSGFGEDDVKNASHIAFVTIADYTGPDDVASNHKLESLQLDVQSYTLKAEEKPEPRRRISQDDQDDDTPRPRVLLLPNVALKDEWTSLIYDDHLPSQLLRYLTRMLGVMKQPGLNLASFNWNRLCLLHGPPGSGKSTLCRALAQKLSIRLSKTFPNAMLVEVNTNSLLSKYFGESGKLIGALFERIYGMAQSSSTLICVVMDEVETIAGSRERVANGGECNDGLRATNQLLTALDRLRSLPNVIVLCTSNLLAAIDPAFLDRVDIKQLIPSPSPEAIYNIFRDCLNELVRANLIDLAAANVTADSSSVAASSSPSRSTSSSKRRAVSRSSKAPSSSAEKSAPSSSKRKATTRTNTKKASSPPENTAPPSLKEWTHISVPTIPTFAETQIMFHDKKDSPGQRVCALAQKCDGFSGRTLRRLPILGLAMYTWGGSCSLDDAVSALEAAVDQELKAKQTKED